jgi:multimeric flavodoxin WrbA
MKILAFNGSPRMENGATDIVLNKFLDGARSAGAEIEKVYIKKLKINQCIGCFTCWVKTPGTCVFKDDMLPISEKLEGAEIWVFATPIYTDTMTSYMKILLERFLPRAQPYMEKYENRTRHPLRYSDDNKKHGIVVISVCGFPERTHFDPLSLTFKRYSINAHAPIIGEIYKPAGEMMRDEKGQKLFKGFFKAVQDAGQEIVRDERISKKTQKIIDKEIPIPKILFRKLANKWFDKQIKTIEQK